MTIPTATICTICGRPFDKNRMRIISHKNICPTCFVGEQAKPRQYKSKPKTKKETLRFNCFRCKRRIPEHLEQVIEVNGEVKLLCPKCANFTTNLIKTVRGCLGAGKSEGVGN